MKIMTEKLMMEQKTMESADWKTTLQKWYLEMESGIELPGISSGIGELDLITDGFHPGHYMILAGGQGAGKTALALNFALEAAKQDICLYFTLETKKKQLVNRLLSSASDTNRLKMRNPIKWFNDRDWSQLTLAIQELADSQLHIFDKGMIKFNDIIMEILEAQEQSRDGRRILVIIDYLELLGGCLASPDYKMEMGKIHRSLKRIAHDMNVAIIGISSSLAGSLDEEIYQLPSYWSSKEHQEIVEHADLLAILADASIKPMEDQHHLPKQLMIAKHRNGPVGTLALTFDERSGKFHKISSSPHTHR
jgi:replicative DNA helicase